MRKVLLVRHLLGLKADLSQRRVQRSGALGCGALVHRTLKVRWKYGHPTGYRKIADFLRSDSVALSALIEQKIGFSRAPLRFALRCALSALRAWESRPMNAH